MHFVWLVVFLLLPVQVLALEIQPPTPGHFTAPFDEKRAVHSYSQLVEQTRDAVVRVDNWQTVKLKDKSTQLVIVGNGSGVIVDAQEGYIVTNNHVVKDAEQLSVLLADGRTFAASVIGVDPYSDLAVLRVNSSLPKKLAFADSQTLKVGDVVFSAGSPQGLDFSFSQGIISALDRGINADVGYIQSYIQTDASINPGNSGGPLLDTQGRIVGINTLKRKNTDGIGFTVPAKTVVHVAQRLIDNGQIERGVIGIRSGKTITPALALQQGLSINSGYELDGVIPGFPAFNAGLRKGDIITGAGQDRIDNDLDFQSFENLIEVRQNYPIVFNRNGLMYRTEISVTEGFRLKYFQVPKEKISQAIQNAYQLYVAFGAAFTSLPERIDRKNSCRGLSLELMEKGSQAQRLGMQIGDVLEQIGNSSLAQPAQLSQSLQTSQSPVEVVYCREGRRYSRRL